MDPLTGAALITGGASVIGGIYGAKQQKEINEQNATLSREFAQNKISWAVEDAKRAGIHPALAFGAPTSQAIPMQVGSEPDKGIARAGEGIANAIMQKQIMDNEKKKTRAEIDLMNMQRANASMDFNLKQQEYAANADAMGKPLWTRYYDNIEVFGQGKMTVWLLDEQAAESMEGTLPMYMTITANGKKMFGNSIKELIENVKKYGN